MYHGMIKWVLSELEMSLSYTFGSFHDVVFLSTFIETNLAAKFIGSILGIVECAAFE